MPFLEYYVPANPTPEGKRYFAIVIEADDSADLGGVLHASTNLGNIMRARVPLGCRVTRSIEITRDVAENGIR